MKVKTGGFSQLWKRNAVVAAIALFGSVLKLEL